MKHLHTNTRIALFFLAMLIIAGLSGLIYSVMLISDGSAKARQLDNDISLTIMRNEPEMAKLKKRHSGMDGVVKTVEYLNGALKLADSYTSATANKMQMHILQCAANHKVAIRNYVPKVSSIVIDSHTFKGGEVAFSAHGDFKPIVAFIADLESTLPQCKLQKTILTPDAATGGKLKAAIEIFILNSDNNEK